MPDLNPTHRLDTCPVTKAVDVMGGKWKPLIIHSLLSGTRRFGELRRLIPNATQQMMTMQLRELERDGIIHREVYREVPPKVEYSLTPLGQSLSTVFVPMMAWGEQYLRERPPSAQKSPTHPITGQAGQS